MLALSLLPCHSQSLWSAAISSSARPSWLCIGGRYGLRVASAAAKPYLEKSHVCRHVLDVHRNAGRSMEADEEDKQVSPAKRPPAALCSILACRMTAVAIGGICHGSLA